MPASTELERAFGGFEDSLRSILQDQRANLLVHLLFFWGSLGRGFWIGVSASVFLVLL